MRRKVLQWMAVLLLLGAAGPLRADHRTTAQDIIRMHEGGLKDETILKFLRVYRARVELHTPDLEAMTRAGLSQDLIDGVLDHAGAMAREERLPPARAEYVYPRNFYVDYPYDPWVYPSWFYVGFHLDGFHGHPWGHGHFGGHHHSGWHGGFHHGHH